MKKPPLYYEHALEAPLYSRTSKRVLYMLMRDYAIQVNESEHIAAILPEIAERIEILRQDGEG